MQMIVAAAAALAAAPVAAQADDPAFPCTGAVAMYQAMKWSVGVIQDTSEDCTYRQSSPICIDLLKRIAAGEAILKSATVADITALGDYIDKQCPGLDLSPRP